jgi:hypothetical protein
VTTVKCPNPTCPYQFNPAQVPVGVVLSCPLCGMQFSLGAPAAPAPPAEALSFPTAREPGEPAYRSPAGDPRRLQSFALVLLTAIVLAGAGLAVYFTKFRKPGERARGAGEERPDVNLRYTLPPAPWERDENLRAKLGSPYFLAFKRTEPAAFMAFGAKYFDTRMPRHSEVMTALTTPLVKMFDNIPDQHALVKGLSWLGRDAIHFGFRGTPRAGGSNVMGECLAVAHAGVAYWAIGWANEEDYEGVAAEFAAAREGFRLLSERGDWTEKRPSVVTHRGDKFDYTILDPDGIWKDADRKPETEDPKADKLLVAKIAVDGSDLPDEAELLVYVLDAPGDPLDAVRKYVEKEMNRDVESRGTNTFTKLEGEPEGDPAKNTVPASTAVLRLRSKNDRSRDFSWLIALSAIRVGDKVVGVHARCRWDQRAAFDAKFVQVAGSLRAGR